MWKHREGFGLTGVALWLLLGCGGRSDTELYSEIDVIDGSAGTRSSSGGATGSTRPRTSTTALGGAVASGGYFTNGNAPASGGWVTSGGWVGSGSIPATGGVRPSGGSFPRGGQTSNGGTLPVSGGAGGTANKGACCAAHGDSPGCNDPVVESCVCKRDAICCAVGWDAVCASEVITRDCGVCGTGGTPNVGGGSARGGATAAGAATGLGGTKSGTTSVVPSGGVTGGAAALGGSAALAGAGGSTAAITTSASGGIANTGGTSVVAQSLIDDLEDGDGDIYVVEGRSGYWYTFNDDSAAGVQQPVSAGMITAATPVTDNGSRFAAWTQGRGFVSWGAGIALYLRGPTRFYNANKYRGISFWAKVTPGHANVIRVNLSDHQTVSDGKLCVDCWDHFGVSVVLSETWNRYSFLWKDLTQRGWGSPLYPSIDPAKLRGIEFGTQEGVEFELYVDDVAFIP